MFLHYKQQKLALTYAKIVNYDDIMDLPHHVSGVHRQMPRANRAAQFMPFAALTGYDDAVQEIARLTDRKIELEEDAQARLNEKMRLLMEHAAERPAAEFLVFRPDGKKAGGCYVQVTGEVRRVDEITGEVTLVDGRRLVMEDVLDVRGEFFALLEGERI